MYVLRPTGKQKFNGPKQMSLFMQDYEDIRKYIESAVSAVLMVASPSGVRCRTIDELIKEFDNERELP